MFNSPVGSNPNIIGSNFIEDKKTEKIIENSLTEEEVETTLDDFKEYLQYLKLLSQKKPESEMIYSVLYNKFCGIDLDKFLERTLRTLTALNDEKNMKIPFFDQIRLRKESLWSNNMAKWALAFPKENFSQLAEIVLLYQLFFLNINIQRKLQRKFQPDVFFGTIIFHIDKKLFLEKYYGLIKNSFEDCKTSAEIHYYGENYDEVLKVCTRLIDSLEVQSEKLLYLRGMAKRELGQFTSSDLDLKSVIAIVTKVLDGDGVLSRIFTGGWLNGVNLLKSPHLLIRAKVNFVLGAVEKALEDCEILKKMNLTNEKTEMGELNFFLAQIDFSQNKIQESLNKISVALEYRPGFQEYLIFKQKIENTFRFNEILLRTIKFQDIHFKYS